MTCLSIEQNSIFQYTGNCIEQSNNFLIDFQKTRCGPAPLFYVLDFTYEHLYLFYTLDTHYTDQEEWSLSPYKRRSPATAPNNPAIPADLVKVVVEPEKMGKLVSVAEGEDGLVWPVGF